MSDLDRNTILEAEFNYVAQMVFQNQEDRANATTFYLTAFGSFIVAIVSASREGLDGDYINLAFGGLFVVVGDAHAVGGDDDDSLTVARDGCGDGPVLGRGVLVAGGGVVVCGASVRVGESGGPCHVVAWFLGGGGCGWVDEWAGVFVPVSGLVSGSSPVAMSATVSGLAPRTQYFVQAAATTDRGSARGDVVSVTTAPVSAPSATRCNSSPTAPRSPNIAPLKPINQSIFWCAFRPNCAASTRSTNCASRPMSAMCRSAISSSACPPRASALSIASAARA